MVLADDNFASIARAVREGRTVYENLRKAILFTLPTNGGEAGTIVFALLAGLTLPISPVKIPWVNMITAVTLSLAFAFEPPERDTCAARRAHCLAMIWSLMPSYTDCGMIFFCTSSSLRL
jgi:magnesium-transporting ATPase (P-type)